MNRPCHERRAIAQERPQMNFACAIINFKKIFKYLIRLIRSFLCKLNPHHFCINQIVLYYCHFTIHCYTKVCPVSFSLCSIKMRNVVIIYDLPNLEPSKYFNSLSRFCLEIKLKQ